MADAGAKTAAGDGLTIDSVKDYYGKVRWGTCPPPQLVHMQHELEERQATQAAASNRL